MGPRSVQSRRSTFYGYNPDGSSEPSVPMARWSMLSDVNRSYVFLMSGISLGLEQIPFAFAIVLRTRSHSHLKNLDRTGQLFKG